MNVEKTNTESKWLERLKEGDIFNFVDDFNISTVSYDSEVALSYVTPWREADTLVDLIPTFCIAQQDYYVVDAFAGLGGNTIAFYSSDKVHTVVAFETNFKRYVSAHRNLEYHLDTEDDNPIRNIDVFKYLPGYYQKMKKRKLNHQIVLFFDFPWGENYKQHKKYVPKVLDSKLDKLYTPQDLIDKYSMVGLLIFKLPYNFDTSNIKVQSFTWSFHAKANAKYLFIPGFRNTKITKTSLYTNYTMNFNMIKGGNFKIFFRAKNLNSRKMMVATHKNNPSMMSIHCYQSLQPHTKNNYQIRYFTEKTILSLLSRVNQLKIHIFLMSFCRLYFKLGNYVTDSEHGDLTLYKTTRFPKRHVGDKWDKFDVWIIKSKSHIYDAYPVIFKSKKTREGKIVRMLTKARRWHMISHPKFWAFISEIFFTLDRSAHIPLVLLYIKSVLMTILKLDIPSSSPDLSLKYDFKKLISVLDTFSKSAYTDIQLSIVYADLYRYYLEFVLEECENTVPNLELQEEI